MREFVTSLTDRLLAKALREDTAGACVAWYGDPCGSPVLIDAHCTANGRWYERWCNHTYNCSGACGPVDGNSCYTTITIGC